MKLQDLASVRTGLVLSRKQSKELTDYRYPLINLRCIQQEGNIDLNKVDIYEARESLKKSTSLDREILLFVSLHLIRQF